MIKIILVLSNFLLEGCFFNVQFILICYNLIKEKREVKRMEEKILELELEKAKIKTSNIWHLIFTVLCFPYAIIWAFALMS